MTRKNIQEFQVPHPSNMIDLYAREIPEGHHLRELLENGRQAGATEIRFDGWVDPSNSRTLARVSDNGTGMEPTVLEARLTNLHDPESPDTFGIGARIATLPWNHAGVAWVSRVEDGEPAMVLGVRSGGQYGLYRFLQDDGRVPTLVEPDPGMLSPLASGHGTSVILYGMREAGDTWKSGTPSKCAHFLSRRYWTFGDCKVTVHGWNSQGHRDSYREVLSTSQLLDQYAVSSGAVPLGEGDTAMWFVLDEATGGGQRGLLQAGVGVLHGDEIYERSNKGRRREFGVIGSEAQRRVFILVCPSKGTVQPNGARTKLIRSGAQPLPWRDWGLAFIDNMPDEIRDLLPTANASFDPAEIEKFFGNEWRRRISPTRHGVQARSGAMDGEIDGDPEDFTLLPERQSKPSKPDPSVEDPAEPTERHKDKREPTPRRRRAINLNKTGQRGRPATRSQIPNVVPVDPENWDTDLENFDFNYIKATNTLYVKKTGAVIGKQIAYWSELAADLPPSVVADKVQFAYGMEIAGKIVHYNDVFAGRPGWESDDEALTPRSLTLASLGLHFTDAWITQSLDEARRAIDSEDEVVEGLEGVVL